MDIEEIKQILVNGTIAEKKTIRQVFKRQIKVYQELIDAINADIEPVSLDDYLRKIINEYPFPGRSDESVVQNLIDDLRKRSKDAIYSKWSIGDIKSVDESMDDEACRYILGKLSRKFDASIGINWDVIATHIDMYKTVNDSVNRLEELDEDE